MTEGTSDVQLSDTGLTCSGGGNVSAKMVVTGGGVSRCDENDFGDKRAGKRKRSLMFKVGGKPRR